MKKILSLLLALVLISTPVFAIPSKETTASVTDVSSTIALGGYHVIIVNDGTDEIYLTFNSASAATTADFQLNADESITLDSNDRLDNVKVVCASGETASIRVITWN